MKIKNNINEFKYCGICGEKNPHEAEYCWNCGKAFRSGKGKIIAAGILLMALLAGSFFAYRFVYNPAAIETPATVRNDTVIITDTIKSAKLKPKHGTQAKPTKAKLNSESESELESKEPESESKGVQSEQKQKESQLQHITYPSGESYTGFLNDMGLRHGEGTYEWPSGNKYVGSFINDKMTGRGTYYYASGGILRYEGSFVNGRIHGEGVLYIRTGDIITRTGQFKNGQLHGEAIDTYKNGKTKTHVWENGNLIK